MDLSTFFLRSALCGRAVLECLGRAKCMKQRPNVTMSALNYRLFQLLHPFVATLERRRNTLTNRKGFSLKAKFRTWPWLSDMFHIRSIALRGKRNRENRSRGRCAVISVICSCHPGDTPGANGWFLQSIPIQMLPPGGCICGRLT